MRTTAPGSLELPLQHPARQGHDSEAPFCLSSYLFCPGCHMSFPPGSVAASRKAATLLCSPPNMFLEDELLKFQTAGRKKVASLFRELGHECSPTSFTDLLLVPAVQTATTVAWQALNSRYSGQEHTHSTNPEWRSTSWPKAERTFLASSEGTLASPSLGGAWDRARTRRRLLADLPSSSSNVRSTDRY